MRNKWFQKCLSGLVSLCFLCGALSAPGAFAEFEGAPVETPMTEDSDREREALPTELPTPEANSEGEDALPPVDANAQADAATQEPTLPEADAAATPTPPQAFTPVYARLKSGAKLVFDDDSKAELATAAIVCAFELDEAGGGVHVALLLGDKVLAAWVALDDARALEKGALKDYQEAYAKEELEGARVWKDWILCPVELKTDEKPTKVDNLIPPVESATDVPATDIPVMDAPIMDAPVTNLPAMDAPAMDAPVTNLPAMDAPIMDAPVTNLPAMDAPIMDAPATNLPAMDAPIMDAPATEASQPVSPMEAVVDLPAAQEQAGSKAMDVVVDVPLDANALNDVGTDAALNLIAAPEDTENQPKSVIAVPSVVLDYVNEQLIFAAEQGVGEIRVYRAGEAEAIYAAPLGETNCVALSALGLPQGVGAQIEAELAADGVVSPRVAVEVPARPEFVAETDVQIQTGHTTATIVGGGSCEYALSLPEADAPEIFGESGQFLGLMDGVRYALWARTPAAEGRFASAWTRNDALALDTMAGVRVAASFSDAAVEASKTVTWSPEMTAFDAAREVHFLGDSGCVDGEIAGNYRYIWRDAAGNALAEAPRTAGSYTLELATLGAAEHFAIIDGGKLSYVITPCAAPELVWPTAGELTYGQRLSESALAGGSEALGSFSWVDGDQLPAAGEHVREVAFAPLDRQNYAWTEESLRRDVSVRVRQRPATIYAGRFKKLAGEHDPALTASTEGVLEGEKLSYSLSRKSGEAPGKYAISVSLGKNPNYNVAIVEGSLTIEARSLNAKSVTVASIPRQVYTGYEIEPKPVVRDGSTRLHEDKDYRLEYNGNRREGVGTVTLTGIGNYSGSRTVEFTIYKLSTTGAVNNNGVEEEEGGALHGFDEGEGTAWDVSGFTFLHDYERVGDPLYDGYLGTGDGLKQVEIVRDGADNAVAYEFLPIENSEAEADAASPEGTILVSVGPDASGEPSERKLVLSGVQLARLYLDGGAGMLLFRNCDAAMLLDVYELLSGDAACLAGMMRSGEANSQTDVSQLNLENMPEYVLSADELYNLKFELCSAPVAMENGEIGYALSVWMLRGGERIEISNLLPMLNVCANVDGLYEAGEESEFVERCVNARMGDAGDVEELEGDLMFLPEESVEGQRDAADRYAVEIAPQAELPQIRKEENVSLEAYRCANLTSPWAGAGVYFLLDR